MAKSNAPYVPPPTKSTPELRKDFYKARRPELPPAETAQGPVSVKQINDLKTPPPPPEKIKALNPPGMSKSHVNNAEKIAFMQSRLNQAKGVAKDRFQRAAPKRTV